MLGLSHKVGGGGNQLSSTMRNEKGLVKVLAEACRLSDPRARRWTGHTHRWITALGWHAHTTRLQGYSYPTRDPPSSYVTPYPQGLLRPQGRRGLERRRDDGYIPRRVTRTRTLGDMTVQGYGAR